MSRLSFVYSFPHGSSVALSVYASPKKPHIRQSLFSWRAACGPSVAALSFSLGVSPSIPSSLAEMFLQSSPPEQGFGTHSPSHSD